MSDIPVETPADPPAREPLFAVPAILIGLGVAMAVIHVLMTQVLSEREIGWMVATFAVVPERYLPDYFGQGIYPGGHAGDVFVLFTHAFLHANWLHLGVNVLWLLAMAAPVARRFGPVRFLAFFLFGAMCGAAGHLAIHWGDDAAMLGASGAVSAVTGGLVRFAFLRDGPMSRLGRVDPLGASRVQAPGIGVALRQQQVLVFVAAWIGLNLLFGLVPGLGGLDDSTDIAWQAHLGGFVGGFLGFGLFDPVRRGRDRLSD